MSKSVRALILAASSLFSLSAFAVPALWGGGVAPTSPPLVAGSSGTLEVYYTAAQPGSLSVEVGVSINGTDLLLTGLNNHAPGIAYGDMLSFGPVNAGDTMDFFIQVVGGARFYTDPSRNSDSINHAWVNPYAGDGIVPAGINIAFEDLAGGGDLNYRDHGITFRIAGAVPEPASAALMMLGVAGLVGLRRAQRR